MEVDDDSEQTSSVNPYLLPTYRENVNEGEKKPEPQKSCPIRKGRTFRKFARAITQQRKLNSFLQDIARQGDDHTKAKGFVAKTVDGQERLSFNVNAFKAHIQSCGTIPEEVKEILLRPSWTRSSEEVEQVLRIVKRMKGFDRYPMYVKRELAKVVYYAMYNSRRVIIRQGHIGVSFYFIVSGSVIVERIEEDKVTGERHIQIVGEMTEADSFGELALLHDIRRAATIICKETSEFLIVDKEDFNEVLRMSHQIEYEKKMYILTTTPAFDTWTINEIKQTVLHAKLQNFNPNTIIVGCKEAAQDFAYFIISGKCHVVRDMRVVRNILPSGKARFTLPRIDLSKPGILHAERYNNKTRKIERKLLVIKTLVKGDYFGVGEDLGKTYIIASGRVYCILINHIVLLKRERGKYLEEMKRSLIESFPTTQQAFQGFVQDYNWKQYKKRCLQDIFCKHKKTTSTTYDDVPFVVRQDHAHYLE
ncbi:hypothetical protein QZH41_008547 [Actinostola sp. cb2023]|nr:hypothetical protein QZH41_008547 [Actinostola sp. cb2023]